MVPLKMMRQRSVLAADQVFALSSVAVELPKYGSVLGPSPLSLSASTNSTTSNDVNAISSESQRWVSWRQKLEDCLWLASAFFILYYGDFRSDFFTLLANDVRVWRTPLHMGSVCLVLDCCMVMVAVTMKREGWLQAPGVIQAVTIMGSLAFILSLFSWPSWWWLLTSYPM